MPAAITADQLLARIKARAQIPSTEGRLTDAEILALADDALLLSLGREVYDADDGRWIRAAPDVSVASGTSEYRIPSRAWSGGLDAVLLVDAQGNEIPLGYVDRSEIWQWESGGVWGAPRFTILGDKIRLLPTPTDSAYSLRVRYVRRPSRLVEVADCAKAMVVATDSVTATVPSAWAASEAVDVVQATHHADALGDDISATISGTTITLTVPDGMAVGDYVCRAGESCVVQAPGTAIPYLADLVARDVCVALGDNEGADRSAALAESRRRDLEQAIAERSRTRPKVINRNSPLRAGPQRGRWPWGRR